MPNLWNEKGMTDTLKMSKNPNVTVRMRGVMEKCTFCVQRIQEAKIAAKVKARDTADVKIPTDSFQVACSRRAPATPSYSAICWTKRARSGRRSPTRAPTACSIIWGKAAGALPSANQ